MVSPNTQIKCAVITPPKSLGEPPLGTIEFPRGKLTFRNLGQSGFLGKPAIAIIAGHNCFLAPLYAVYGCADWNEFVAPCETR